MSEIPGPYTTIADLPPSQRLTRKPRMRTDSDLPPLEETTPRSVSAQRLLDADPGMFDGYIARFSSYLTSTGSSLLTPDQLSTRIRAQFKKGADMLVGHSGMGDTFETIAGYAENFTAMTEKARELSIPPFQALMLATRSGVYTPDALARLQSRHPDLSPFVIAKAALSHEEKDYTDNKFVTKYKKMMKKLEAARRAFPGQSEQIATLSAHTGKSIKEYIAREEDLLLHNERVEPKQPNSGWVHIDITPQIARTTSMSNITTMAVDLHRLGYGFSQEDILAKLFGFPEMDLLAEYMSPTDGPSMRDIAKFVEVATDHSAQIITYQHIEEYGKYQHHLPAPDLAEEVLRKALRADMPVHINTSPYSPLVTGYYAGSQDKYSVYNPITGEEHILNAQELDKRWGDHEASGKNGPDTGYMMMILRPKTSKR